MADSPQEESSQSLGAINMPLPLGVGGNLEIQGHAPHFGN